MIFPSPPRPSISIPPDRKQNGLKQARYWARHRAGRGMIRTKLLAADFSTIEAEYFADLALYLESRRRRLFGLGRCLLGIAVLLLGWWIAQSFSVRIATVLAVLGAMLVLYGVLEMFHRH